ncbi:MAG: MvaI/BcnI family restriction endonuclease [Treponema sp.]|nr:MvaI/BcnI family restriction endonuclease [Treponema sp.]
MIHSKEERFSIFKQQKQELDSLLTLIYYNIVWKRLLKNSKKIPKMKNMDYVPSLRRGTTGIGYTLETLLGITENNDAKPDID